MPCKGCEVLPAPATGAGRLYLAPRLEHTLNQTANALKERQWPVETVSDGVFAVSLREHQIETLVGQLSELMSTNEQMACPALVLPDGVRFGLQHLAEMMPLNVLVGRQNFRWLTDLLRSDRLEMHFQPIVHAANSATVFAYEALARGVDEDGSLIAPAQLFAAARATDLMFHMDRAARVAAIRQSRQHGIAEQVFINFNPTSVYDPVFCLQTTFNEVKQLGADPRRFVFEVVETDLVDDPRHLRNILREYRRHGFRVALDDLGAGYSSLNLMQSIRPDFVKLDREMVHGVSTNSYLASITARLIDMARDLGVAIIAEGIEQAEDWAWLRERRVDYGQGFLFGRPSRVPAAPADLAQTG